MGADAKWVCNTCRTVCSRGGRPIFKTVPVNPTVRGMKLLKQQFSRLMEMIELVTDDKERYIFFLDDLVAWLSRHENHDVHIGSDYSTDFMDLDEYRDETVDGKISSMTRIEAKLSSINQWSETVVRSIQIIIEECVRGKKTPRQAAGEIYCQHTAGMQC